jgi:exocyst complex protein 7
MLSFSDCLDKPFPSISDKDIPELRLINRYFAAAAGKSYGEYSTMKIFAEIRGGYVSRSLSTSSAASISTARKQNADAIYRRGTCGIGIYSSALEGMISAEFDIIKRISDPEDWSKAIVLTSQQALYDFGKTLRELNAQIQANMMADCFLAYEILEIVSATAKRLDLMTSDLKKAILETLQPIHDTAKSALSKMLEDTKQKVQAIVSLPLDGSSVGVISETITRLQNLSLYHSPVTTIMSTVGDGKWTSSPATSASHSIRSFDTNLSASEGSQIFAHYASDMLEMLVTQLDGRARLLLKNGGIQNVFMCNNVAAIENQLKSSEIDNLIPAIQPRLDMWRSKYVKMYLTSWNAATGQLLDVQYTNRASGRPTSGGQPDSATVVKGLNSKEREIIKEKFRVFNSAFDELVAKHKNYNMERDVRSLLGREVQRVIEPLYGRFWDRYHEIDKGKGKYVRYSKSDLSVVFMGMT